MEVFLGALINLLSEWRSSEETGLGKTLLGVCGIGMVGRRWDWDGIHFLFVVAVLFLNPFKAGWTEFLMEQAV